MVADMTKNIYVNTPMESDLVEKLDEMVMKKESTRAQMIRLLVREAYEEFKRDEAHRKTILDTARRMKAIK